MQSLRTIGGVNRFLPKSLADASGGDIQQRVFLRALIAACQAGSIVLTWPLWQPRHGTAMPNLPIFDAAILERLAIPMGEVLLGSLVVAMIWPRIGAAAHAVLLALAIALDQQRIQPEFISLAILLAGTVRQAGPRLLARCHLISLWLFAGIHKLLSGAYLFETGPDLAHGLFRNLNDRQAFAVGLAMALAELTLGVVSIHPKTRRWTPTMAAALHGGILLALVLRGWNSAVWPWNLALAIAGYAWFSDWSDPLWLSSGNATQAPARRWQIAAGIMLFYPILYYVNLCDAYLAWCVYSANVPEAVVFDAQSPQGERLFYRAYRPLNVPFSPAVRLYERHFHRTAQPGDVLEIDDPRPLSRWLGRQKRRLGPAGPADLLPTGKKPNAAQRSPGTSAITP
jgi:hypothetical protein